MSAALDQLSAMSDRLEGLVSSIRTIGQRTSDAKQMLVAMARPRDSKPGLSGRERFTRHATMRALSSSVMSPDDVWMARYCRKGAVDPATTVRPTWASELVVPDVLDFLAAAPKPRLFPQLTSLGLSVSITGAAKVPYAVPGSPKGGWVQESEAIPVVKLTLATASLVPKKLASISTFTDDLTAFSTFDVERIVASLLQADLGTLLDTALTDTNPASALRPAGLRSFNSALPAAPAGPGAMASDLSLLAEAINSSAMVILCNPLQTIGFSLMAGTVPFPILTSDVIPQDTIIAVDSASFISTTGDPSISASENALLHESDAPTAIGIAGTPNTIAAPARSLWQSQCNAIRCILPASWTLTAANRTAWISGTNW